MYKNNLSEDGGVIYESYNPCQRDIGKGTVTTESAV